MGGPKSSQRERELFQAEQQRRFVEAKAEEQREMARKSTADARFFERQRRERAHQAQLQKVSTYGLWFLVNADIPSRSKSWKISGSESQPW